MCKNNEPRSICLANTIMYYWIKFEINIVVNTISLCDYMNEMKRMFSNTPVSVYIMRTNSDFIILGFKQR